MYEQMWKQVINDLAQNFKIAMLLSDS